MAIFDDVILISSRIQAVPVAEVEALEQHLGFALPDGYRDFITRFGEGDYCDLFRIYPPVRIREEYASYRDAWEGWYYEYEGVNHWFFEGSEHILSEAQLQACIIIGDSFDGDEIVYYPPQPDKLFVLPRHDQRIYTLKADFSDLHIWIGEKPRLKLFTPWHNRAHLDFRSNIFSLDQATCLAKFRQRWGDHFIMLDDESDAWSWNLIFFLPAIGGRVQITQDEGVTRTIQEENVTTTFQGNGVRWLFMQFGLDEDAVPDVRAFVDALQAQGLLTLLTG
jgi:hypothetical protein